MVKSTSDTLNIDNKLPVNDDLVVEVDNYGRVIIEDDSNNLDAQIEIEDEDSDEESGLDYLL